MSRQGSPNGIALRHNDIAKRAGTFLGQAFDGPHKDKRLAQQLGISPNMASLLRRGRSWTVERLEQVRDLYGWDFVGFVFGAPEPDYGGLRDALQLVLDRLPPRLPVGLTQLWFDDAGQCLDAPAGHAELVRRRTGLMTHVQGDLVASYCRNRGWLAAERDAAGRAALWHSATALAPRAATAARDWLTTNAERIVAVRRYVEIDGATTEIDHESAAAAASALDRAAKLQRRMPTPIRVRRKPLDEAPSAIGEIIRVFRDSRDHVLAAAYELDLMPTSSILSVRGSSVTNDFMGHAIVGLDRRDIVGKNVMDRKDAAYGAFVHREIMAALIEPSLSEVCGTVYGRLLHYERLLVPVGANQVLSISRVLKESSA